MGPPIKLYGPGMCDSLSAKEDRDRLPKLFKLAQELSDGVSDESDVMHALMSWLESLEIDVIVVSDTLDLHCVLPIELRRDREGGETVADWMEKNLPDLYTLLRTEKFLKVVLPAGDYPKLFDKNESHYGPVLDPLTLTAMHDYNRDLLENSGIANVSHNGRSLRKKRRICTHF